MHIIDIISQKTAEYRVKRMKGNYTKTEEIVSKYKGQPVKLSTKDMISIQKFGWFKIYSEVFIVTLILVISIFLKTFLPTFLILLSLMFFRKYLGGMHLNSINKCTVFTSSLITLLSLIAKFCIPKHLNLLLKCVIYVILGLMLELISKTKLFNKLLKIIDSIKFKKGSKG